MTTTPQEPSLAAADLLEALGSPDQEPASPSSPGRGNSRLVVWTVLLVVMLGGLAFAVVRLGSGKGSGGSVTLTHTVGPGELLVTITDDGTLESATNVEIKCEVAGGSTILWIVEDGAEVSQGDKLVELDSSQLEDQINEQKIAAEKARATKIQAEKEYAVAKIALEEYLEGTYRQESQIAAANVTIALENLRTAENILQHTQRMFRKGYVSSLERESQRFAVARAKLELAAAETAKDVLERFTKAKMLEDLESQRDTAEAKMLSDTAALALEESRLARLEKQLEKCVIFAPGNGMVIYANENRGRRFSSQQSSQIEEGAEVREQQTLLRLPDLSQMQVKVAVHESKVDLVRRGMRARVRVQDNDLQGTVVAVATQPEPTSFFSAGVKEYAATVKIEGEPEGLRPGLTAEVEILVEHLKDVLTLPVAAVVEQRGSFYCWVKTPQGTERRPLITGSSNENFVAVVDGVAEGDVVVLNPRAAVAAAREDRDAPRSVDVEAKFGPQRSAPSDRAAERTPDLSQGGTPAGINSQNRAEARQSFDVMQFDSDKDGKISRAEAPERMQGVFDLADRNQDGQLDAAEIRQLRSRVPPRNGSGPPP